MVDLAALQIAAGTRAMMADHQLLSDLLHELDAVLGCAARRWVRPGALPTGGALSSAVHALQRFDVVLPGDGRAAAA